MPLWLRCAAADTTLMLPVWPTDSTETMPGWTYSTLDRPGREPLEVPTYETLAERSLGFTLRRDDYAASITGLLVKLRTISKAKTPVQLVFDGGNGARDTGLWRMDPPLVTEMEYADDGSPSVADVSVVLRRATEATVNVGPVKRVRGGGRGYAT